MEFSAPIKVSVAAALTTFKDGLISRSEIFFDARPFDPSTADTRKVRASTQ
jgi:hypothetical protein